MNPPKETKKDDTTPAKPETAKPALETKKAEAPVAEAPKKPLTDNDVIDISGLSEDVAAAPAEEAQQNADGGEAVVSPSAKAPAAEKTGNEPPKGKPEEKPAAEKSAKIRFGKKEFDTVEQLQSYIDGLDAANQGILEKLTPKEQPKPEKKEPTHAELAELFFENPEKAIELLEARIEKKIDSRNQAVEQKQQAKAASDRVWKNFYTENADLNDFPEIVDRHFFEMANDPKLGELSHEEGLKLVAQRARDNIKKLRAKLMPTDELPSDPAITSGGGGNRIPQGAVEEVKEDFVSEIKRLRQRGA